MSLNLHAFIGFYMKKYLFSFIWNYKFNFISFYMEYLYYAEFMSNAYRILFGNTYKEYILARSIRHCRQDLLILKLPRTADNADSLLSTARRRCGSRLPCQSCFEIRSRCSKQTKNSPSPSLGSQLVVVWSQSKAVSRKSILSRSRTRRGRRGVIVSHLCFCVCLY